MLQAHKITDEVVRCFEQDMEVPLAWVHPASEQSVHTVLSSEVDTGNGRSEWAWLRLPNGDLMLGVFPQGDTYFEVEKDACYTEVSKPSGS